MVEHQRGTHFCFFVVVDLENAGVADAFQNFKLPSSLADTTGTYLRARGICHCVNAHTPLYAF